MRSAIAPSNARGGMHVIRKHCTCLRHALALTADGNNFARASLHLSGARVLSQSAAESGQRRTPAARCFCLLRPSETRWQGLPALAVLETLKTSYLPNLVSLVRNCLVIRAA